MSDKPISKTQSRHFKTAEHGSLPSALLVALKEAFQSTGIRTVSRHSESRMIFPDLWLKCYVEITNEGPVKLVVGTEPGKMPRPSSFTSNGFVYNKPANDPTYDPVPRIVEAVRLLDSVPKVFSEA